MEVATSDMGSVRGQRLGRAKALSRSRRAGAREQELAMLLSSSGDLFPGLGYRPENHKRWMEGLAASNLRNVGGRRP